MKRKVNNFKLFSAHSHYAPGVGGMFVLAALFLLGAILGALTELLLMIVADENFVANYGTLIAYPIYFIPPMLYASAKSRSNSFFEEGIALDSNNFKPFSGLTLGILVVFTTLAAIFAIDPINCAWTYLTTLTPGMKAFYDIIVSAMESMTGGPVWVALLLTSIFAPFFEEWLCRGMVLRGLLQVKKPVWAIIISAAFFAIIHGNPWQALNAFILGVIFGYVYYKTGSLKLTMLMHATNNALAVLMSGVDSLSEYDYMLQAFGEHKFTYVLIVLVCWVILYWAYTQFRKIPAKEPESASEA